MKTAVAAQPATGKERAFQTVRMASDRIPRSPDTRHQPPVNPHAHFAIVHDSPVSFPHHERATRAAS